MKSQTEKIFEHCKISKIDIELAKVREAEYKKHLYGDYDEQYDDE